MFIIYARSIELNVAGKLWKCIVCRLINYEYGGAASIDVYVYAMAIITGQVSRFPGEVCHCLTGTMDAIYEMSSR